MYKLVLSIETSCDETSLAFILQPDNANNEKDFYSYLNWHRVLFQIVSSQTKIHENYGGIIPEITARQHSSQIHFLFSTLIIESVNRINNLRLNSVEQSLPELVQEDKNKLLIKSFQPNLNLNYQTIEDEFLIKNNLSLKELTKNPNSILNSVQSIMVTSNPGLPSALRVGVEFAKTIKYYLNKKYNNNVQINLINHLQGHIASCFYECN